MQVIRNHRDGSISKQVLEYYRARPNEAIYSSAVANELGVNVGSVQTATSRLAETGQNLRRVTRNGTNVRGLFVWNSGHDVTDNSPEERTPRPEFTDVTFPTQHSAPAVNPFTEGTRLQINTDMESGEFGRIIPVKANDPVESATGKRGGIIETPENLYEFVGTTKAGLPIVRDMEGILYTLREL